VPRRKVTWDICTTASSAGSKASGRTIGRCAIVADWVSSGEGIRSRLGKMQEQVVEGSRMPKNTAKMKSGDRVVLYNNVSQPRLVGVHTYAEDIEGVGFTGYRWISAADRVKDLPDQWYPVTMKAKQVSVFNQQPPLVVFDVDSTLIHEEVIELLAAHAGKEAEVAEVTERAMRGEIEFAESLHYRVATLEGLPVEVLDAVAAAATIHDGAQELVQAVHQ